MEEVLHGARNEMRLGRVPKPSSGFFFPV